jgi:hypothetical protein
MPEKVSNHLQSIVVNQQLLLDSRNSRTSQKVHPMLRSGPQAGTIISWELDLSPEAIRTSSVPPWRTRAEIVTNKDII